MYGLGLVERDGFEGCQGDIVGVWEKSGLCGGCIKRFNWDYGSPD